MSVPKFLNMEQKVKQKRLEKIAEIALAFNSESKERLALRKALEYEPHTKERINALKVFFNLFKEKEHQWIDPGNENIWSEDQYYLAGVPSTKLCAWWLCYSEKNFEQFK